ncbi:MAG: TIGR02301 family protein [Methylovirgula sp.]|jgi:uncharacterized protein (TIGR02301 family)
MSRPTLCRYAPILAALLLVALPSRMSLAVSFGFVPDTQGQDQDQDFEAPDNGGQPGLNAPPPILPAHPHLPHVPAAPANLGPGNNNPADASPDAAPPYEPQLLRLSELLGALAYLQDLCGQHDGAVWREKMSTLLDAEAKSPVRKERLAGAYNRGFKDYSITYRLCTANAQAIIGRFLNESIDISHDVVRQYGPS